MNKEQLFLKLGCILKNTEILMKELEEERDEVLDNLKFENEEEMLTQYYKKILTSIYRMRNNSAAILLRNDITCTESKDTIDIIIDGIIYNIQKQALKNILQKEYDEILKKNIIGTIDENAEKVNSKIEEKANNKTTNLEELNQDQLIYKKASKEISKFKTNVLENAVDPMDDFFFSQEFLDDDLENENPPKDIQIEYPIEKTSEDEVPLSSVTKSETVFSSDNEEKEMSQDKSFLFNDFDFFSQNTIEAKKSLEVTPEKVQKDDLKEDSNCHADDCLKEELGSDFKKEQNTQYTTNKLENSIPIEKKGESNLSNSRTKIIDVGLFKPNIISFDIKKTETEEEKKKILKPKFSMDASSDDPDELIKQLKKNRNQYDKQQLIKKTEEELLIDSSDMVFDLSTGSVKKGMINTAEATNKINKVADSLIQTSRKDKLMDASLNDYIYKIQNESDYERNIDKFILDIYTLDISILDDNDCSIRTETARLIVAPMNIPETGSNFVTDICAYLESGDEASGTVVLPGGKTTVAIRCKDYSVFVRGAWENGIFVSSISAVGNGSKIKSNINKEEMRPVNMEHVGIGHNVLLLDHATTVHIIPVSFENIACNARYMCVVIKDYGVDQDAECLLSGAEPDVFVKGEKLKYNIRCTWDNYKNLTIFQRISK